MMNEILYANVEILYLTEVIYLIENGKKQHKKSLKIKTRQIERGGKFGEVIVFLKNDLETVENYLKQKKYSFKYETRTESLPAEQSRYGGNILQTTFLVINL